jgi:DNA-binding transcriptional regulator YiaG
MSVKQLKEFLTRHGLSNSRFAKLLGVTSPAVDHWLAGRREIPPTARRLMGLIELYPQLIQVLEAM